jgi:hypothetical protein
VARRRKKSPAKKAPRKASIRRAVSTLAADVPPGPGSTPGHKAGTEVVLTKETFLVGVGQVGFASPSPHRLLLDKARRDLQRAMRLKKQLHKEIKTVHGGLTFSSDSLAFEFFQEAMSGIVLLHAALDSFASDHIHDNFSMELDGGLKGRGYLIARGIEKKFSVILSTVVQRENLMNADSDLWKELERIKQRRDDVAHFDPVDSYSIDTEESWSIFSKLLNCDFQALLQAVERILLYYDERAFTP